MKKFLATSLMVILTIFVFAGCATETKWADTSAMISQFCGGSIYVSSKKVTGTFGVYLQESDVIADAYYVDFNDYTPGQKFDPKAENAPLSVLITKTLKEVDEAMLTEKKMGALYVSIAKELTDSKVEECDVKYTGAEICTHLGGGTYSCTANIVCDKKIDVSVHYIFKGFEDLDCPDASLILTELQNTLPKVDNSDQQAKKEEKKEQKQEKKKQKAEKKEQKQKEKIQKDTIQTDTPKTKPVNSNIPEEQNPLD